MENLTKTVNFLNSCKEDKSLVNFMKVSPTLKKDSHDTLLRLGKE